MIDKSKVILPKKFWDRAQTKDELKKLIGNYMATSYPNYRIVEIGKYYAICEIGRN